MTSEQRQSGDFDFRSLQKLRLQPVVDIGTMLGNMRSALARGLPSVKACRAHGHTLSIAAGGPSIAETYPELSGYIAAINGSLRWLLERGVVPNACGVLDPGAHIADMIEARAEVTYFVASICDPAVFEKLRHCHVVLWHPTGSVECEIVLQSLLPNDWFMVGGGCTMGLRWINLGYVCGFREFRLHGLDSSFRGSQTHAYPDRADAKEHLTVSGRQTRLNFVNQVQDFFGTLDTYGREEFDPVSITVYGEGLLQDVLKDRLSECSELSGQRLAIRLASPQDGIEASSVAA